MLILHVESEKLGQFSCLVFFDSCFSCFFRIPVLLWSGLKLLKKNVPEEQTVQVVMKQNGTWSPQSLLRRNLIQMEVLKKKCGGLFCLLGVLFFFP